MPAAEGQGALGFAPGDDLAGAGETGLDRCDRTWPEARAEAWSRDTRELEQADRPRPLASIRLQQLQHPRVIAAGLARQRPADHVRQVEVADAHRVGVPERGAGRLRGGPRTDALDGHEPSERIG